MKSIITFFAVCLCTQTFSQSKETLAIRKFREENTNAILKEYVDFLTIPNTANDTAGLRKNTDFIQQMMQQRGIQNVQLLQAATPNTPPVVYGEVNTPGATQTLIFYAHYDGQPLDPAELAQVRALEDEDHGGAPRHEELRQGPRIRQNRILGEIDDDLRCGQHLCPELPRCPVLE